MTAQTNSFERATVSRFANDMISVSGACDAAKVVIGEAANLLVHTPHEARFLRMGPDWMPYDERGIEAYRLDQAFEVRFFSSKGEISWRRAGSKSGRALLTADHEVGAPDSDWKPLPFGPEYYSRLGQRLLWGVFDNPLHSGWSQLSSPRIGPIAVPIARGTGDRAVLKVVEYARREVDGNVVPAGERLVGFGWVKG